MSEIPHPTKFVIEPFLSSKALCRTAARLNARLKTQIFKTAQGKKALTDILATLRRKKPPNHPKGWHG